jgi:predicted nuclease with RNAse H fold
VLSDRGVDRRGQGKFVEVYPRAARDAFGMGRGLEDLQARAPWLELDEEATTRCVNSEHCMDAVVAALVARASALDLCEPIPEEDRDASIREGWIALPLPESLQRLV